MKMEDIFSSRSISSNMKKLETIIKSEKNCVINRVEALYYYSLYPSNEKNVDSLLSEIKTDDLSLFFIYTQVIPSKQHLKKLFLSTKSDDVKNICVSYMYDNLSNNEKKILSKYNQKVHTETSLLEKEVKQLFNIRDVIHDISKTTNKENIVESVVSYFSNGSDAIGDSIVKVVCNEYLNLIA